MKWFYIIIIIIIYNLFKKNKSVKKQEVTKEQFIPNELFKFVIINTDTDQKFELITLSQLSKKYFSQIIITSALNCISLIRLGSN